MMDFQAMPPEQQTAAAVLIVCFAFVVGTLLGWCASQPGRGNQLDREQLHQALAQLRAMDDFARDDFDREHAQRFPWRNAGWPIKDGKQQVPRLYDPYNDPPPV